MPEKTNRKGDRSFVRAIFLHKYLSLEGIIDLLKGHEKASIALLYVVLICTAYAPVVFSGRSLQASLYHPFGVLNDWPAGYDGRKPLNTYNIDLTHDYSQWPLNKLVGDIYKMGEIPLWNPYQGVGVPLAGQAIIAVFSPYRILECISPVWTWDYFILGRLWIAGFFTYLFLRLLGLSCTASILGGILYMFSGNLIWHINREDMVDISMTVPVMLFCLERLMKRQLYKDIAFAAGAFSLILVGQPEAALWVMLLGSCYIVLRLLMMGIKTKAVPLFLVLSILLGFGLSAPAVVPFLEMVLTSLNIHTEGLMGIAGIPQTWSYKLGIIFPTLFTFPTYYRIWPENGAWDFLGGYTGVLTIYLMFLGLFIVFLSNVKNLRWELFFFAGSALVILLKNLGVHPFVWLGYLPIINACWAQRWAGPTWSFSFAVAAAIGFEVLKRNSQESGSSPEQATGISLKDALLFLSGSLWRKIIFTSLSIFLIVELILELIEIVGKGSYGRFFAPTVLGGCGLALGVLITAILLTQSFSKKYKGLVAFIPLGFLELWYMIPRGYNHPTLNQLWIPVGIGLLVIILIALERYRLSVLGGILFVLAFLIIDAFAYFGLPDKYDAFTELPYVKYLKKQEGYYRVIGSEGILMPNYASALGIQDLHYINTITPSWLHEYVENNLYAVKPSQTSGSFWFTGIGRFGTETFPGISPDPVSPEMKLVLDRVHGVEHEVRMNLPCHSLLGLKYIITPNYTPFNTSKLREENDIIFPLIYHDEVNIYENPEAFPRAFVAHSVTYADSYQEAQALIRKSDFDLRHTVVLEEPFPASCINEARNSDFSTVVIKQYRPNKVTIEAKMDSPGILVLSDLYYPGWQVYVDGVSAKLYRVDGIIRGVLVQEGDHTVVFRYAPPRFRYSLILFASSLTVCFGCLIVGSRRLI